MTIGTIQYDPHQAFSKMGYTTAESGFFTQSCTSADKSISLPQLSARDQVIFALAQFAGYDQMIQYSDMSRYHVGYFVQDVFHPVSIGESKMIHSFHQSGYVSYFGGLPARVYQFLTLDAVRHNNADANDLRAFFLPHTKPQLDDMFHGMNVSLHDLNDLNFSETAREVLNLLDDLDGQDNSTITYLSVLALDANGDTYISDQEIKDAFEIAGMNNRVADGLSAHIFATLPNHVEQGVPTDHQTRLRRWFNDQVPFVYYHLPVTSPVGEWSPERVIVVDRQTGSIMWPAPETISLESVISPYDQNFGIIAAELIRAENDSPSKQVPRNADETALSDPLELDNVNDTPIDLPPAWPDDLFFGE